MCIYLQPPIKELRMPDQPETESCSLHPQTSGSMPPLSWKLPSAFSSTKNKQVPGNNHFGAKFQYRGERKSKLRHKGAQRARPHHLQQPHQMKTGRSKPDCHTSASKDTPISLQHSNVISKPPAAST
ncbi:Hypothetical protein GSB_154138 [Giardia duodenalis]|uniref:Uncharacterized protein n=1 Tax=Giardia intestinalis TaxID=5741 RepID=V6TW16_GIAIN|nr:Hypothetical protein GSB_154138 [Giardia intestinalis]